MSVGKNIYRLRRENQFSQEELALKINVTRQAISKWELDEVMPDTNNLVALSDLFKVSVDQLLGRDSKNEESIQKPRSTSFDQMTQSTGKFAKKHWAKIGYYLIYMSLPLLIFSFIAHSMTSSFNSFIDDSFFEVGFYNNPVSTMLNGISTIGILMLLAGIGLAIYDYYKNKKSVK